MEKEDGECLYSGFIAGCHLTLCIALFFMERKFVFMNTERKVFRIDSLQALEV